jgi:hypothetical protein
VTDRTEQDDGANEQDDLEHMDKGRGPPVVRWQGAEQHVEEGCGREARTRPLHGREPLIGGRGRVGAQHGVVSSGVRVGVAQGGPAHSMGDGYAPVLIEVE